MRKLRIALAMLTICSCTLLKRNSKTTDEDFTSSSDITELSSSAESSKRSSGQHMVSTQDSTGAAYSILFWPRGKIDFSTAGGFSGEFDSIQLKGRQRRLTKKYDITSIRVEEAARSKVDFKQKQKLEKGSKHVSRLEIPDAKVVLVFMILCMVLFILIRSRLTQN